MPCRDYYDENPGAYAREQRKENETKLAEKQRRLDTFARHMCFLCTAIDQLGGEELMNDVLDAIAPNSEHGNAAEEIKIWWKQHQKDDAAEKARKEEEKLKKAIARKLKEQLVAKKLAALAKLNAEDRKALGI